VAETYVLVECSRVPWRVENLVAFEEEIFVMNLGVAFDVKVHEHPRPLTHPINLHSL